MNKVECLLVIKIKMYPAQEGDAFLVSVETERGTKNILIDMGLTCTYKNEIKPDLIKLNSFGQKIDLLIITHIDQDHIQGAIDFIQENGESHKIIQVERVWHNSYRHLQFAKTGSLSEAESDILNQMILQNNPSTSEGRASISAKQGSSLSALLLEYKYNWNIGSNLQAINIDVHSNYDLDGIIIKLLSPDTDKLKKLERFWLKELNKKKYNFSITDEKIFDDAFEFFMMNHYENGVKRENISSSNKLDIDKLSLVDADTSEVDSSPTNGSSISFVIEYDSKKLLFLADAHEDIIVKSLRETYDDEVLYFDSIKIPHHGSNNNFSTTISNMIESKRYFVSTNANKHHHPNAEVISKIIAKPSHKTIYFNYSHEISNTIDDEELMSKYSYDVVVTNEVEIE